MAIFYVNVVNDDKLRNDVVYPQVVIGLFKECKFEGRGNFCGWYGTEYYLNTELYAHYVADGGGLYSPEKRISEITVCDTPIKYEEVMIGSCYWTRIVEAETVQEAIVKFKNADWHR